MKGRQSGARRCGLPASCLLLLCLAPVSEARLGFLGLRTRGSTHPYAGHSSAASRVGRNDSEGRNIVNSLLHNDTLVDASLNQDLACFRYTGGTCAFFGCKEETGPTDCVSKLCFCKPGYCASVRGVCERLRGRTLGKFSIRFADPAETQRPYLGVDKHHRPAAIELAGNQWRVALTHDGFVRFESTQHVGQVLTLHQDRRRRTQAHTMLLGAQANRESGSPRAEGQPPPCAAKCSSGMSEDDHLWPRLRDIRFISPPEASFLVRSTWGGFEIWHPQTGASLATAASTDWMRSDGELGRDTGLAECYPRVHTIFGWGAGCQSRNLVAFDPELPADAVCARCSAGQVSSSPWRFWKAAMPWLLMAALTP